MAMKLKDSEDIEFMLDAYASECSIDGLAEHFHCSPQLIINRLRANCADVQRGGKQHPAYSSIDEIKARYMSGDTPATIADAYGVGANTIYRWVRDAGVATATRRGRQPNKCR
jgi:hypothetical protein